MSACQKGEAPTPTAQKTDTPQPTSIPTITVTPTQDVVRGTITIWHGWEETQRSALYRRIAAFQTFYPEVQFDVLYIPEIDLEASFIEAMGENAGPKILLGPASWGPDLYNQGLILDLSDYTDPTLLDTLNPAALGNGRYRQALLSLPLHIEGVVLYRNLSIIPNPPSSFDSLTTLALAATHGGNVGAMLERSFYFSAGHLYGLGGALMDSEGNPAFNADDYRASLKWLELLKKFEQAGPAQYQSDSDLKLFKDRRLGFLIETTDQMYNLAGEIDPLNLAIDPWPDYQAGHLAGFVQSEGAYLTKRAIAEENQASWLFMRFLLSPDSQVTFAGVGYIPSVKSEVIASKNLRIGDPFITQAMEAMSRGAPYPTYPELNIYQTRFDLLLQSVLFQGAEAKDALQVTYANIQTELSSWRTQQTPAP